MNLLRSICCLFGSRCTPEETRSTGDTTRREPSDSADLGQTEAELERTGKKQMSHMDDIEPGGGAVINLGRGKIAVWKGDDGNPHAVSASCTHKGCTVTWTMLTEPGSVPVTVPSSRSTAA